MKTACLLLLSISWATLAHPAVLCPLPWAEGVPRPALPSAGAGRVRGRSAPASQKANRPKQHLNGRQRSLPGEGMKLPQPGSGTSGGAARSRLIQARTVTKGVAVRTPSVVRPAASVVNNTRHRTPNPAVVSGSPNSHGSNTAVINGTRTSRKP